LATHQIGGPGSRRIGERGAFDPAAHRAREPEFAHQPLDSAAGHLDALAVKRQPHLARPVHPVVRGVDPRDVLLELVVADLAAAGLTVDLVVVGRRGDLNAELNQPGTDRLDTPPQTIRAVAAALMIGDESTD
jgi:hypothetical protein